MSDKTINGGMKYVFVILGLTLIGFVGIGLVVKYSKPDQHVVLIPMIIGFLGLSVVPTINLLKTQAIEEKAEAAVFKAEAAALKLEETAQTVSRTAVTVDKIKIQTDGYLSEQLQIGMTSAVALALQTQLPEHELLAKEAKEKYQVHKDRLAKISTQPI